jgi:leucyl aminopeptidase
MNFIYPVFEGTSLEEFTSPYLQDFNGKSGEQTYFIDESGQKHIFIGLGKAGHQLSVIQAARSYFFKAKKTLKGAVHVRFLSEAERGVAAEVVQGVHLAEYEIGYLKGEKKEHWFDSGEALTFETDEETMRKGRVLAEAIKRVVRWGDAPGNYKTPQQLATWIQAAAEESGYTVERWDAAVLEEKGMQALLSVGRGSRENPPVFCILKYSHPEAVKTVGLVGKGVTFDTGGVSLKPGDNMNYMKSDMGGAAAVAGTLEVAAKLGLKVNLIGAIPITENCIDSYAIKPGDVIGSYSGKTIEVINTDAEGRLILADALSYLTENHPTDALIDLATLTGNAIMALGYKAAALISPNDDLAAALFTSGQKTGEKVWRMPHWDEYKDSLKSDVADLKNLAGSPIGGAINAGKFLEEFIREHEAWAHLDIAGTAFSDSEYGSMKSATGFGIRLLVDYLESEGGYRP